VTILADVAENLTLDRMKPADAGTHFIIIDREGGAGKIVYLAAGSAVLVGVSMLCMREAFTRIGG